MSRYEAADMGKFMRRVARAMVRRAEGGELDAVRELRTTHKAIGDALNDAARAAHDAGYTWADIAAELGMTKQAAHKRWAEGDDDE